MKGWICRLRRQRLTGLLALLLTLLQTVTWFGGEGVADGAHDVTVGPASSSAPMFLSSAALSPTALPPAEGQAAAETVKGLTAAPEGADRQPQGHWVTLDGQRVIEIRVAAGAQKPADLAHRISLELKRLAEDPAFRPSHLVVEEAAPYWMVTQQFADGSSMPRLAVDERAARSFGLSRQALAARYRDQLQSAIRQYRNSHSLESWLRGTALAAVVLGLYLLWLHWQRRLHDRLRRSLFTRSPTLRVGSSQVLEPGQLRALLLLILNLLHWVLLVLISYLLIPLLLGFFPPTQVLAED